MALKFSPNFHFRSATFFRNNCYKKEVMKIDGRSLIGSDRDLNEVMPRSRGSRDVNTQTLLGTDCIKMNDKKRRPYQTKLKKNESKEIVDFRGYHFFF